MAIVAREAVPVNDMKMSSMNAAIDENLISIEMELHTLGMKLFGACGDKEERMEPAEGIPISATMQGNLDRAQRINEIITAINQMI